MSCCILIQEWQYTGQFLSGLLSFQQGNDKNLMYLNYQSHKPPKIDLQHLRVGVWNILPSFKKHYVTRHHGLKVSSKATKLLLVECVSCTMRKKKTINMVLKYKTLETLKSENIFIINILATLQSSSVTMWVNCNVVIMLIKMFSLFGVSLVLCFIKIFSGYWNLLFWSFNNFLAS